MSSSRAPRPERWDEGVVLTDAGQAIWTRSFIFLRILLVSFAATASLATSTRAPGAFIISSPDRATYARFVPTDAAKEQGRGTVFRLNTDGTEQVLGLSIGTHRRSRSRTQET